MSTMCDIETLRLFVNERLTAVAEDILAVFVRTIVDYQQQLDLQWRHSSSQQQQDFVPAVAEKAAPDRQKRSPSRVQEEPPPLQIKQEEEEELLLRPEGAAAGSVLATLPSHNTRDTEPVASTSTQHMNTQADAEDYRASTQATSEVQLLSSNCSESDVTEDSEEWEPEETSEDQSELHWTPTSPKTKQAKYGQRLTFSNKVPVKDLTLTKQTSTATASRRGQETFHCSKIQRVQGGSFMVHSFKYKQQSVGQYSCSVCGKAFSRNESLKRHMMTHTGEKPFTCPICSKGCGQMSDLKKHMRSHTGEKPFTCEVCGKKFTRTETLKRHMALTHTGETPFYCTVCGEQFGQSASLRSHMEIHAGQNHGQQQ